MTFPDVMAFRIIGISTKGIGIISAEGIGIKRPGRKKHHENAWCQVILDSARIDVDAVARAGA